MKRYFLLMLCVCAVMVANAQHDDSDLMKGFKSYRDSLFGDYKNFRDKAMEDYVAFRDKVMADYIEFVRSMWEERDDNDPVPEPKIDPVPPPIAPPPAIDDDLAPKVEPLEIDTIYPPVILEPEPQPIPVEPIVAPPAPVEVEECVEFMLFGTPIKVRFDKAERVELRSLNESAVANALEKMVTDATDRAILDCLEARERLALSDWAYIQMLRALATEVYGSYSNSAVLFMSYVYMRSGYKMRLAMDSNRLYMLYATEHVVFNRPSYSLDGAEYYCLEDLPPTLQVCRASYMGETPLSLVISTNQLFAGNEVKGKAVLSKKYADMSAAVSLNSNLLDFYSTYPKSMIGNSMLTCWAMYAKAPIDKKVSEQLYGQLRGAVKGLSELEAVNKILDFVQTGLVYEYDDKVWGGDRPFFAEESLYYEYADCEDRSILFSRLVRDLVGLDVALLVVPGHMLAAVRFNGDVSGSSIDIDGEKFVICEPTCLNGASVGWCGIAENTKISVIRL